MNKKPTDYGITKTKNPFDSRVATSFYGMRPGSDCV